MPEERERENDGKLEGSFFRNVHTTGFSSFFGSEMRVVFSLDVLPRGGCSPLLCYAHYIFGMDGPLFYFFPVLTWPGERGRRAEGENVAVGFLRQGKRKDGGGKRS